MSWEESKRSEPCFCGHGTITTIIRTGDWPGQFESTAPSLNCEVCAREYRYMKVGFYSDTHEPRMAWVKQNPGKSKKK
jgi:hypothetical protein